MERRGKVYREVGRERIVKGAALAVLLAFAGSSDLQAQTPAPRPAEGAATPGASPTPPASLAGDMASEAGLVARGARLFRRNCTVCHGQEGKGDGPAAASLRPPPANLTDPKRVGGLSFEDMVGVVTAGKGFMPSFAKVLSPQDRKAVVHYVRTLSASGRGAVAAQGAAGARGASSRSGESGSEP
ncbi:MAG: c-type cytochrome [Gemmatimonadota bacterium]